MSRTLYKSVPDLSKARDRTASPKTIREGVNVTPAVAEYAKGRRYFIKTFGCQGNVRDEEILAGYLEAAGMKKTEKESEAGFVIINTCAVRENAEEKVYGEIGKFKANHQKDPSFLLCLCGCMMQEEGKAQALMASYPYVNIIFGTHNVADILKLIDEKLTGRHDLVDVHSFAGDIVENLPSTRLDSYKAFVNITYGCDKFCTYCIVPYTRGRERSRALGDVLSECRSLVEEGYQEITLLGQNVNSYGKDFQDGTSFATVLEEVAKLGIPRLRFMTSHPWDFSDEMIDIIAKYPNIMPCIHLPVQSGSTSMLRRMGRRYTRESYLELVKKIRERIPGCALTTDIIVGFPNETEAEFLDTLSLCEEVKYDAAFTFIYSPRKGTPAARMVDNVSDATKHERFNRLLKVVEQGVLSHSAPMVGNTYKVLVDGPSKKDPEVLSGYTEQSKLINFRGPQYLKGQIVEVKVTENHAFSMIGELVDDPLIALAKNAKRALDEDPRVQAYLAAKSAFEDSEALKAVQKEIQDKQSELLRLSQEKDDVGFAKKKKEVEALRASFKEHPLFKNYQAAHEELQEFLVEVKGVLS